MHVLVPNRRKQIRHSQFLRVYSVYHQACPDKRWYIFGSVEHLDSRTVFHRTSILSLDLRTAIVSPAQCSAHVLLAKSRSIAAGRFCRGNVIAEYVPTRLRRAQAWEERPWEEAILR